MDNRTKKLRAIMKKHKLKARDVADMLGREPSTVRVWRCQHTKRVIPQDTLELLELKLGE